MPISSSLIRILLLTALLRPPFCISASGQQPSGTQVDKLAEDAEQLLQHHRQLNRFRWLSSVLAGDERVIQDDLDNGRPVTRDRDEWTHGLQITHNELTVVRSVLLDAQASAIALEAEDPIKRRREYADEKQLADAIRAYSAKQDKIFEQSILLIKSQLGEKDFMTLDKELKTFVHDQLSPAVQNNRQPRESDFNASLCSYNAKQDQIFDDAIFQIQQQLGEKSFTNLDQELRRFVHDQNSPPASSTKSWSTQPNLAGDRSEVQS